MIKKFELVKPENLMTGTKLLKKFDHPVLKRAQVIFYKIEKHIIIYRQSWVTRKDTGITKLLSNQVEIPASAIQWIVDTIEKKFFKPPAEGGLPADVFFHNETIEREKLQINRGFAIGGEGVGGYVLANISRKCHMSESSIQEFPMQDPFLFEHGLMEYLKELAQNISNGKV